MTLVASSALLIGCRDVPRILQLDGDAFGTRYQVQVVALGAGPCETRALASAIEQELADIDQCLSTWREDSEISAFNRRRDQAWVRLSPPFAAVMAGAMAASRETDGAFDVTLRPLSLAWGFQGEAAPGAPSAEQAAVLRVRTGMHLLELSPDGSALRKIVPGVEIDLSAIAKGYAVDRIGTVLESAGCEDWLAEIGGEVLARGRKPDGTAWRIAVTPPAGAGAGPGASAPLDLPVIELRNEAVATSGDYRNALLFEGRRLGHVFDPSTGRPAAGGVTSATVTAPTTMQADALATAFLVMAPEASLALADRLGVGAMLILGDDKAMQVMANDTFRDRTPGWRPAAGNREFLRRKGVNSG